MVDAHALLTLDIPETRASYGWRDAAVYALGTGAGMDPDDPETLRLVGGPDVAVLPSFATVLGYEGFWVERLPTGIDVGRVLHGEQGLRLHAPLPPSGEIVRKTRVTGVVDKGARGALVYTEDVVRDAESGAVLATLDSTILCRGDGGCGSTRAPALPRRAIPARPADGRVALPGSPQQALIYRLSGDLHLLHVDPDYAVRAGFARPILHGLAVYGAACRVMLGTLGLGFASMSVRFSAPAYPGEPLALLYWHEGGETAFRIVAPERDAVVLDDGWMAHD